MAKARARTRGRGDPTIPGHLHVSYSLSPCIELIAALKVALGRNSKSQVLKVSRFKEAFKVSDAGRMPHFPPCFRFELTNALPRDLKLPAYFLESSAVSIDEPKPLFKHLPLPLSEGLEHVLDFLLQQNNGRHVAGIFRALILDKVAEISLFAFAHGRLERDRLLGHLQDRADALDGQ